MAAISHFFLVFFCEKLKRQKLNTTKGRKLGLAGSPFQIAHSNSATENTSGQLCPINSIVYFTFEIVWNADKWIVKIMFLH